LTGAIAGPLASRAPAFFAAAVALDLTLTVYLVQGGSGTASLVFLAGTVLLAVLSVLTPPAVVDPQDLWVALGVCVGLELMFYAVLPYRPPLEVGPPVGPIPTVATCGIGLLAVAFASARKRPRLAAVALFGTWLAAVAARLVVVQRDLPPTFDVPLFQLEAAQRLVAGLNPYAVRSMAAYPYGPIAAVGAAAGQVFGDPRLTQIVADVVIAAGLFVIARGTLGVRCAALLGSSWLWHGSALFVIWQGFPEPLLAALLMLAIVAMESHLQRRTPVAGVLLGLAAATKQFGVLVAGFALVRRGPSRSAGLIALATGIAVSLPFLVLDAGLFVEGTLVIHAEEPSRGFALNLLPLLGPIVGTISPVAAPILGAVAGILVAFVSRRRSTSWIEGSVVGLLVFCVFGGISFVNYYVVPLALVLAMVPLSGSRRVGEASVGVEATRAQP
jgi:hypothetical protein